MRYFPAGEVFLMQPAGEMWSVVTLSPKMPSGARALDFRDAAGLQREILEERRLLDVGGFARPTHRHCRCWTGFRSTSDFARRNRWYSLRKTSGLQRGLHQRRGFRCSVGQMSFRKTSAPSLPLPIGSCCQVNVHAAGQRERDDQRRRHEEIRLDVLVDARLEIAVAGKHRRGDQIVL